VLAKDEIVRRNRFRIDDALLTIPGVNLVGENVNVRGGTGYSLLGLGGSRVLMLIDDVPVLTSDLGRANWDILPVTEVERVELLKGAASVLYGSGGISGVVNIITKRPTNVSQFSFRQSAGYYSEPSVPEWRWTDRRLGFYRSDLSYSNSFGPLGLRLAVSRHASTSDRENGDFGRWYVTMKPVIRLDESSTLALFATYNRDSRGFFLQWKHQNEALETNFHDRINVDGFAASAIYSKLFSSLLSLKIRASYNAQLIGLPFDLTEDFNPALGYSSELQMNWLPHADHNVTAGIDYRQDRVKAKYYGEHRGDAASPYIQETWRLSRIWQLSAGMRYDTYVLVGDSAETQLSPKLGASYNPFPGTFVHFSFGRGFRAPSIAERFTESQPGDNVRVLSNPGLHPERSTLFDVGIRQRVGGNLSAEVTAFSNEYHDLIEIAQTSTTRLELQFRNFPDSRIQGIETEVKLRGWHNRVGLRANGTWMDSRTLETDPVHGYQKDDPLPYRPKFSGFISPSLTFGPWTFEGDYRYVTRLDRVSFFPRDERVPQKVLDLRAQFQWRMLTFLFQVRNATNYNYTVVEQSLGEIRNFSLAVSGDF